MAIIKEAVEEHKLTEDVSFKLTHDSKIQFTDGNSIEYWIDENNLWSLVFAVDLCDSDPEILPRIVQLNHAGGDFESYYPLKNICVIDMPLLKVMEAAKREMVETDTAAQLERKQGPKTRANASRNETRRLTQVSKERKIEQSRGGQPRILTEGERHGETAQDNNLDSR